MCPLFGCGGLASDGREPIVDDDVRAEALPQRFADCDELLAYARGQADGIVSAAPTGSPFPPLFGPGGGASRSSTAYAEWPEASRQGGAGRVVHTQRADESADDYYVVTDHELDGLSSSPGELGGIRFAMPPGVLEARGAGHPAWVFARGRQLLVVGELESLPSEPARAQASTFFWQLERGGSSEPRNQSLSYVNARLIGARSTGDAVQVALLGDAPSAIDFTSLPDDARTDAARLGQIRAHNRDAIAAADAGDWLPRRISADPQSGTPYDAGSAALDCGNIYAPATPSGLELLTLVDLRVSEGLGSWQASGLYTGNVQIFSSEQSWAFVTEPWWSVSEDAASLEGQGSPETILHTFSTRSRQLFPLGSIAVRGAPEHDPALAAGEGQWFLQTHTAYGPGVKIDQGRIWSFEGVRDGLQLLGKSPSFDRGELQRTDFVPGAAYVRTGDGASETSLLVDLSDPAAPELLPGPSGDVRILAWSEGRHLRVDAAQIHLLSGLRELEQYPQLVPPSRAAFADPLHGWLVDIDEEKPYRKHLLFRSFDASEPRVVGSIRIPEGSVLPPLIESDTILNVYYRLRPERGTTSYGIQLFDAKTFAMGGGVGGG